MECERLVEAHSRAYGVDASDWFNIDDANIIEYRADMLGTVDGRPVLVQCQGGE